MDNQNCGLSILVIMILIISATGCKESITGKSILCDYPEYIIDGRCCLDNNNDNKCDEQSNKETYLIKDEVKEIKVEEPKTVEINSDRLIDSLLGNKKENIGFADYSNAGISVIYPKDWEVLEGYQGSYVVFVSPLESDKDPFSENVNIIIQDLSEVQWDLEKYTLFSIFQIRTTLENGFVLESNDVSLSSYYGHYLLSIHKRGSLVLKALSVYIIKDNKAYLITYIAEENKYDNYINDVKAMIDSFRISQDDSVSG